MGRLVKLIADEPTLYRALELRASRNFRKVRHELWVILREVLEPELEEILQRERPDLDLPRREGGEPK